MRRPAERLPQRRLVYELRALIDRGRVEEARALVDEHPRAMRSAHVRHNVGRARQRVLHVDTTPARSDSLGPNQLRFPHGAVMTIKPGTPVKMNGKVIGHTT